MKKTYHLKITHDTRGDRFVSGTLEDLIKYFGYTLEIGNSHNKRVNRQPKTIKSFLLNLKKSYAIQEACCYQRTSIELIDPKTEEVWVDPAGGVHYGDEEDPAKQYE